jgi:hypothetical protein
VSIILPIKNLYGGKQIRKQKLIGLAQAAYDKPANFIYFPPHTYKTVSAIFPLGKNIGAHFFQYILL